MRRMFPRLIAARRSRLARAPQRSSIMRSLDRIERLEQRLVLSAADYLHVSANWFGEVGLAATPASSALTGADSSSIATSSSIERHYIVRLTSDAARQVQSAEAAQSLFRSSPVSLRVIRGLGLEGQLLVATTERDSVRVVDELRSNPNVAAFEEDSRVGAQTQVFPNEQSLSPEFAKQYGLHNVGQEGGTIDADIDAPDAWDITTGSMQVVVSVIDSGVDYTHPDLYLNIWLNDAEIPGPLLTQLMDTDADGRITFRDLNAAANASFVTDLNDSGSIDAGDLLDDPLWSDGIDTDNNGFEDDLVGWDFQGNDNRPFDEHGHGTHVAGILGASGNNGIGVVGVNWTTSILPLRFLDRNNTGALSDAIEAINYQTLLRTRLKSPADIRVSNNSWGVSGSLSQNLFDAVQATGAADILFVAAAGNGDVLGRGIDNDQTPFYPANLDLPNVLSVGALGPDGSLSRFSNFGDQMVDLAAPGVGIVSTAPGGSYVSRNGTSMAAPFVSGTAALVFSERLKATHQEVRDALLTGADLKGALLGQVVDGRSLNALGALTASTFAPIPSLQSVTPITVGQATVSVTIAYADDEGVNPTTLDIADLELTRVGFSSLRLRPEFVAVNPANPNAVTATYRFRAPGGLFDATDNGEYHIQLRDGEVGDTRNVLSAARRIGSFAVALTDPNVYFVNTTNDTIDSAPLDGSPADSQGKVSLRAAIMQANSSPGPQTIVVPDGIYTLTIPGTGEDSAFTGDLDFNDFAATTILGGGALTTTIDAQNLDRIFDVHSPGAATIRGVSIVSGRATFGSGREQFGGGVRNGGVLTLDSVLVARNVAATSGGGVYSNGELTVRNSSIESNRTTDRLTSFGGGGLTNEFMGTVENSSIFNNVSDAGFFFSGGGGGGVLNTNTLTLRNTTISGNTASLGSGGGVLTLDNSDLTLDHVTIVDNHADNNTGGGLEVRFFVANSTTVARVSDSILADNSARTSDDVFGRIVSFGHNLIGQPSTFDPTGWRSVGEDAIDFDLIGTASQPLDPQLGSLSRSDGFLAVHVPLPGSPVIDNGSEKSPLLSDQLGNQRPIDAGGVTAAASRVVGPPSLGNFSNEGIAFQNDFIFVATDVGSSGLYRLDDETGETELIGQFDGGSSEPFQFEELNGELFFLVSPDFSTDRQIWSISGTSGELMLRTTFQAETFFGVPQSLIAVAGKLYFDATRSDVGDELFQFDPLTDEVSLAADVIEGVAGSVPRELTVLGDELYFTALDPNGDFTKTLFRYSPELGTAVRASIDATNPTHITALGGQIYFSATTNDAPAGVDDFDTLFIYSPELDYDYSIVQDPAEYFSIPETSNFTVAGGKLFFPANDRRNGVGNELYFFDPQGSPSIQLAADVFPGPQDSSINLLSSDGQRVYFSAITEVLGGSVFFPIEFVVFDLATSTARVSRGVGNVDSAITVAGGNVFYVGPGRNNEVTELWAFSLGTAGATDIGAVEVTTGSISGVSFHDANGNGRRELGEAGLAGETVFDDLNRNGRRDLDEPTSVSRTDDPATSSDESGQFTFDAASRGSHLLRKLPSSGFVPTSPRMILPSQPTLTLITSVTGTVGDPDRLMTASVVGDRIVYLDQTATTLWSVIGNAAPTALVTPTSIAPGIAALSTSPAQDGSEVAFVARLTDGTEAVVTVDELGRVKVIAKTGTEFRTTSGTVSTFATFGINDGVPDSLGLNGGVVGFYGAAADAGPLTPAGFFGSDGQLVLSIQPGLLSPDDVFKQIGLAGGRTVALLEELDGTNVVNQNFYSFDGLERLRVGDSQRPIPGGVGNFTRAIDFAVSEESIAFRSLGADGQDGIYVGTGLDRNRVIANTQTPIPGGNGSFTVFGPLDDNRDRPSVSIDGSNVVFVGQGAAGQLSLYASIDGQLRTIVDRNTNFGGRLPVEFEIGHQALSGQRLVFHVNFADGSEAIYTATLASEQVIDAIVSAGRTTREINFGAKALPGTIRGVSFADLDLDGQHDPGEPPNANRTIFLDDNQNGLRNLSEQFVVTDSSGAFVFENLAALETYSVRESVPDGGSFLVTLQPTQTVRLLFANGSQSGGSTADGRVAGSVFSDTDGDGRRDAGEIGTSNVTVFVDENGDFLLNGGERSTVTVMDGSYALDQLRGTTQAVRIVMPSSLAQQTSPLGNTFTKSTLQAADSPVEVLAFDADGDGDEDLATSLDGLNEVQFFLNNGRGVFAAGSRVAVSSGPGSLAAGKFLGAGQRAGLVVGHRIRNDVVVLLPQVAGGFRSVPLVSVAETLPGQPLAALGNAPYFVTTGDLNGDGRDDIAVASQNALPNGGAVVTFLSNGSGGFTREQLLTLPIATADSPTSITAIDVDGGGVDLLVSCGVTNSVTVLHNTGTAGASRFSIAAHLPTGGSFPTSVRAGDLNGDGRADLVTTNFASDNVSVFFGQANGTFAAAMRLNAGQGPADARLLDIDRDGNRDIVFSTSNAANRFGVLRNRGAGVFQAAETSGLAVLPDGTLAFALAVGQFNDDNGDGLINAFDTPDVAVSNRRDQSVGGSPGSITVGLNAIVAGALNVELPATQRSATGLDFGLRIVDAPPTITALATPLRIVEDAAEQVIPLAGMSAGVGQSSQLFQVSVSSSNPALFASLIRNHSASNATGEVRFTPAANANGEADLIVTVTDAGLDGFFGNADDQRTARTIRVVVDADDDLPPSRNESMQIVVGTAAVMVDVLVNEDSANPDVGEPLRVFFAESPSSGGVAELQSNLRSLRYSPAAGFVGTETVRYYVTDGRHDPVLATLSVTVVTNVTINLTTNQTVLVQSVGGNMQVLINGVIDSTFSAIPTASVQNLTINGGTGDNLIDLRNVTAAAFSRVGGVAVCVLAGAGKDTVFGSAFNDSVTGSSGNDSISVGAGLDTVFGGTGNDTIDGGLGNDVLNGQDNDDSILGGDGNDTLSGAAGNDFIDGGIGDDVLNGDAGIDVLLGRDGADLLVGGDGNDRLEGEAGADRLRGETGLDTLLGGAGGDILSGGADDDSIDGGDDNDSLFGDFGNDTVLGGAGDDLLRGFVGQDSIDGGVGTSDKVSEEGDTNFTITGLRIVSALFGDETPTNIERFNLSGGPGPNLIDGRLSNVKLLLNGFGGPDTLLGGAFIDNIFGGTGNDVLSGGGSNDVIDGGLGTDFFYERANANVTINGLQVVSIGISPSVGTGTETLVGIENIALVGGDSANRFDAAMSSVAVILLGGKGNDTLIGSNFNDVLVGGHRADSAGGTDSLTGGSGADTFDNDAADNASRDNEVSDSVIANVFASPFPSWLDLI